MNEKENLFAKPMSEKEQLELLEKIENKNHIIIVNKIDLEKKLNEIIIKTIIIKMMHILLSTLIIYFLFFI